MTRPWPVAENQVNEDILYLRDDAPLTLRGAQEHMATMCTHFGWTDKDDYAQFLLFMEEIGELAKEIRKSKKLMVEEAKSQDVDLSGEFADVLGYLLDLAIRFDIDLETAYRDKTAKNLQRMWKV